MELRRQMEGVVFLAAFALCIPAANWLIGNVGTACPPGAPCLIPVAPGIQAPSSVLAIGLALVLRDLVLAVAASSMVGPVLDSVIFLALVFGRLDFLPGQILGKTWVVLLSLPLIAWLRRRDERLGLAQPQG